MRSGSRRFSTLVSCCIEIRSALDARNERALSSLRKNRVLRRRAVREPWIARGATSKSGHRLARRAREILWKERGSCFATESPIFNRCDRELSSLWPWLSFLRPACRAAEGGAKGLARRPPISASPTPRRAWDRPAHLPPSAPSRRDIFFAVRRHVGHLSCDFRRLACDFGMGLAGRRPVPVRAARTPQGPGRRRSRSGRKRSGPSRKPSRPGRKRRGASRKRSSPGRKGKGASRKRPCQVASHLARVAGGAGRSARCNGCLRLAR